MQYALINIFGIQDRRQKILFEMLLGKTLKSLFRYVLPIGTDSLMLTTSLGHGR